MSVECAVLSKFFQWRPGSGQRKVPLTLSSSSPATALTITGIPTETRTIGLLRLPELLAGYGRNGSPDWLDLRQQGFPA